MLSDSFVEEDESLADFAPRGSASFVDKVLLDLAATTCASFAEGGLLGDTMAAEQDPCSCDLRTDDSAVITCAAFSDEFLPETPASFLEPDAAPFLSEAVATRAFFAGDPSALSPPSLASSLSSPSSTSSPSSCTLFWDLRLRVRGKRSAILPTICSCSYLTSNSSKNPVTSMTLRRFVLATNLAQSSCMHKMRYGVKRLRPSHIQAQREWCPTVFIKCSTYSCGANSSESSSGFGIQ